jgi:hypothetical protein
MPQLLALFEVEPCEAARCVLCNGPASVCIKTVTPHAWTSRGLHVCSDDVTAGVRQTLEGLRAGGEGWCCHRRDRAPRVWTDAEARVLLSW